MPWEDKHTILHTHWYDEVRYHIGRLAPEDYGVMHVLKENDQSYKKWGYVLTPGWWAFQMQAKHNKYDPTFTGPFPTEESAMAAARVLFT